MLYKLTASARKLSEGEARPAVLMDAIKAEGWGGGACSTDGCNKWWYANEQRPRPPLLKLNWACFQELSVV